MKLILDLLKEKSLEEQKNYLEKHRNFLIAQIGHITMEITDIEKRMQEKLIRDMVEAREIQTKKPFKKPEKDEVISFTDYEDIMYELRDYPDIIVSVQNNFKIDSIAELLKTDLQWVKNRIRTIKKQHEK